MAEQKSYELFFIFSMNLNEEERENLIKNDGEIEKIDKWGKRRLAYPIKKEHEGFYVLINFKSGSKVPAEITRIARITGGILRHLLAINKNEI
jgi:small subunit ribosomal protein S6